MNIIKELRLGNFVSIQEGHIEFPLTKVRFERVLSGYYEVGPVELTAEWLVKFGFRKSSNFVYYFDSFSWDSRDSNFTVYSDWNGEYAYYVKVEWVHQLQNLYWCLTGKELVLTAENGTKE